MNILITGTSSGIGNGLASAFLNQNNFVWGISRKTPETLIKRTNYKHLAIDLTNYNKLKNELPKFLNSQKQFDLVILNAGVLGEIKWATKQSVEAMKKVMEINVWANKVLLDELFLNTKEIRQVVGISSGASLRSTPGWAPYSLSKAALNILMNAYATEFSKTHFIAFAPGLVDTAMQEYIYNVKETENYPAAKRLQAARYSDAMPEPQNAAPILIKGMQRALNYPSGSFIDIREM